MNITRQLLASNNITTAVVHMRDDIKHYQVQQHSDDTTFSPNTNTIHNFLKFTTLPDFPRHWKPHSTQV